MIAKLAYEMSQEPDILMLEEMKNSFEPEELYILAKWISEAS
jgi:hypothetical protein